MSRAPINLVGIGCGRHFCRSHLLPALAMDRFNVMAAFDPSAASLAKVAKLAPEVFPYTEKLEDALQHPGAYAAVVCSTDEDHLAQARAALEAGLHVLVDKPVITTKAQVREFRGMVDLAARRNLVLTTCLPRRMEDRTYPYGWLFETLHEVVAELGELLNITLDFSYHEPEVEGTWREGRRLLLDHFPHDGDLVYKLARIYRGQPSLPFRARREVDTPKQYLVTGMTGGLPFQCHGSRFEPDERTFAERMQLRFQQGVCTVDAFTGEVELYWFTGRRELIGVKPVNNPEAYDHRFTRLMDAFADAIEAGQAGHAYLTAEEFAMAVEGPTLLSSSGSYNRR